MAYNWTTLSATAGTLITANGLATALTQANNMYNTHSSGNSSVNTGKNTAYNGSTNTDYCNAYGCSTHYSAFAKAKCGSAILMPIFDIIKIKERAKKYAYAIANY